MEKIIIADKTFQLYKDGLRTFIHIPRDERSLELKKNLRFGNTVMLVNVVTNEEIEQRLWFFFEFKENPRFLILGFSWDTKDELFFKRRQKAISLQKENSRYSRTQKELMTSFSVSQWSSYNMLMCYSTLFFVNTFGSPGDCLCFVDSKEEVSQAFVILDSLRLKKSVDNIDDIFEVYSLFPANLLSI